MPAYTLDVYYWLFLQVGNLFGDYRSTIITLHAGAVGSSALMMLLVQIAYTGGISMMACFCFLAGVAVLFNINTFVLLPKYKIPWPLPSNWGKAFAVESQCGRPTEDVDVNEMTGLNGFSSADDVFKKTHYVDVEYQTLLSCLKSPMFLLFLMWFSILQLTNLFFIGTVNPRLQQLSNDDNDIISTYTTVYTALHSTIIVLSFFCGLVLDRNKKKITNDGRGSVQRTSIDDLHDCVLALLLTNLMTAGFNICTMIPILPVQFLTFVLQLTGRAFLFSILVAFLTMA
ncbi:solute carrier family 43 member 3-like [Anneissia japonica]|uniref:solute carrier family 43 member 3-like n=1 Tax=Anneissia japonica TaxID=1529436 RepID=UPI00142582A8|nr:solute carrier family 43 member 3-like [Anneissia japonica]